MADLADILKDSIDLELKMKVYYMLCSEIFPEDRKFFLDLAVEEDNHAKLLRSMHDLIKKDLLPADMVMTDPDLLFATLQNIEDRVSGYNREPPSLLQACEFAYDMENSAGELHYQNLVEKPSDSKLLQVFQDLNDMDKDHAERIQSFMDEKGLQ